MTPEIGLTLGVLALAVILFAFEVFRVDLVALIVLLLLAWLGLVTPAQALSGFASHAVVSVIAVMVMSEGINRSGIMKKTTAPLLKFSGSTEKGVVATASAATGLASSFMQNIGATALFLPAVTRLAKRMDLPLSRILMPMGFAAILGGNLTLVGSGPLIVLNDLLKQSGQTPFTLFSVTPIGLVLLAVGLLYFLTGGRRLLPAASTGRDDEPVRAKIAETWELSPSLTACRIPAGSRLAGKSREEIRPEIDYELHLLALRENAEILFAPSRKTRFAPGQDIVLMGEPQKAEAFIRDFGLRSVTDSGLLDAVRAEDETGFAEMVIPPHSPIAGQSVREAAIRKTFGVEPLALLTGESVERGDFSDVPMKVGNILVVYGNWNRISAMADRKNFISAAAVEGGPRIRKKPLEALLCFAGAMALVLAGQPLSISLLSGAAAMVLFGVIRIDDAYRAVDGKTVVLLGGLIPLGIAMEKTGAADFIARQILAAGQGSPPILIYVAVAVLATLFSLFMSNVAAAVLLIPLVVVLGDLAGLDPRALALLVAVCASNSFILPTHQVNAFLMSPGGYRNRDYLRAGGGLTVIFIAVAVGLILAFY